VDTLWLKLILTPLLIRPQQPLFALDALGEGGWLKAMRLDGYVPRGPQALKEGLFPCAEAL
jgi:hypothetical protein